MATLILDDLSPAMKASIAAAIAKREACGIVPLEHRSGCSSGLLVRFHPDIPAKDVHAACDTYGWVMVNHGGEYLVRAK